MSGGPFTTSIHQNCLKMSVSKKNNSVLNFALETVCIVNLRRRHIAFSFCTNIHSLDFGADGATSRLTHYASVYY